jgi:hypothetical protein
MRRPVPDASVRTSSFFSSAPATWKTWCVIAATGECASSTECSTSFSRKRFTSLSTPLSSVAENSIRWPSRRLVEDAGHRRQEAEVGHVVGLVDDGDLHGIQLHEALLHEVFEAAGAGDDDVDAVLQRRDLTVLVDAAEDRRRLHAVGGCQGLERRVDLRRELAGGREDEPEDAAGAA